MLRTNLSTRPFYNERAVHVGLAIGAALILALTLFNVVQLVQLSRRNTELSTQITADRNEAQRLTREAAKVRRGIDPNDLEVVVASAREANTLIERRTFSWTAFFNHIEATLPPDVMLSSVRPTIDDKGTHVSMVVLGRRTEDIDEFMEKLEATGAFENVLPRQQDTTDNGLQRLIVDSQYVQTPEEPQTTAPAGTSSPPGAGQAPGNKGQRSGTPDPRPGSRGRAGSRADGRVEKQGARSKTTAAQMTAQVAR